MAEPYTRLKDSHVWKDMEASAEKYWTIYPTKLAVLEQHLCHYGNGYEWSGGQLIYILGDDAPASLDYLGRFDAGRMDSDPSENPLFALIPDIAPEDFLKYSATEALTHTPGDRVHPGQLYPLSAGFNHCLTMPENIEVHTLTATMSLMKHVRLHPDRLRKVNNPQEQMTLINTVLNAGFTIIERRGIEENFAKSCAELRQYLPELTRFNERYLAQADKMYQSSLEFKTAIENMTPDQRKKVLEDLRGLLTGSAKEDRPPPGPAPGK